jgi:hypothetical protein
VKTTLCKCNGCKTTVEQDMGALPFSVLPDGWSHLEVREMQPVASQTDILRKQYTSMVKGWDLPDEMMTKMNQLVDFMVAQYAHAPSSTVVTRTADLCPACTKKYVSRLRGILDSTPVPMGAI